MTEVEGRATPTGGGRPRGQHQRVGQADDLTDTAAVDDLQVRHPARADIDIELARPGDHVIEAVERDLDDVALGVVDDAEKRQPFALDVAAEREGGDLYLRLLADQPLRHAVAESAPLRFVELA